MLRLRPYENCDAETIVSWIRDETAFHKWSADRYETYPITGEDMNRMYDGMALNDSFFPMTAFDESGVAGHMILRFADEEKKAVRFGFVIVDDRRRGTGLGKEMLLLAVRYAYERLKAEKITLGVFENNAGAYWCYRAVGFEEIPMEEPEYYSILGENWKCIEMELKPLQ